MDQVLDFLMKRLQDGLLPWSAQNSASVRFDMSYAEVEALAMQNNISPVRYQRNRNMISLDEQLLLLGSCVAVVGCGGLGGYVIEELARLGIGRIVAIDPDIFEEHNLNRQLLASLSTLGKAKVEVALERVKDINPAVTLTPIKDAYRKTNGRELLGGATVVVDALDRIETRLDLAETCAELQIPLVFGAIGGWYGEVATQLPGGSTMQSIFRNRGVARGVESKLGNPSFTPALVASLQVAEVCKLVLGRGKPLQNQVLVIDLHDMELHEILTP